MTDDTVKKKRAAIGSRERGEGLYLKAGKINFHFAGEDLSASEQNAPWTTLPKETQLSFPGCPYIAVHQWLSQNDHVK